MKSRRWFQTPELIQWRYMTECGQVSAPFFLFPYWSVEGLQSEMQRIRLSYYAQVVNSP